MRQSFTWWSFALGRELDDAAPLLDAAAAIGVEGVEMLPETLWPRARAAGLSLVTDSAHDIPFGFNDRSHHRQLQDIVAAAIERAAAAEIAQLIVFSGNRAGRGDAEGIDACVEGLAPLAQRAEAAGIGLLLELLNSRVDHPDYHCDRSSWGFEVVRRVDSPALRVLYDGYHMQLMEGDLSRTIKANVELIGHIHTAGVPGRRDLDDRQEVNWRAIAGLLDHVGYDGWVGHELIPRGDPEAALAIAYETFARGRS